MERLGVELVKQLGGFAMIKGKKLYIALISAAIAVSYLCFVLIDFSRFGSLDLSYDIPPSGILKRLSVLFAASIAWMAGQDGLSLKDSSRMKWAFVYACLGEAAFVFRFEIPGLVFFTLCQILLITRHSQKLTAAVKQADAIKRKKLLTVFLLCSSICMSLLPAVPAIEGPGLKIAVCLYWFTLNLSLLAAAAGYFLKLLPSQNGLMAFSGVFCFYCCDILVGLDAVLKPGPTWLLANSFIWVFYIPALLLLAYSCYR